MDSIQHNNFNMEQEIKVSEQQPHMRIRTSFCTIQLLHGVWNRGKVQQKLDMRIWTKLCTIVLAQRVKYSSSVAAARYENMDSILHKFSAQSMEIEMEGNCYQRGRRIWTPLCKSLFGTKVGSFNGLDKGSMLAVEHYSDLFSRNRSKDMYTCKFLTEGKCISAMISKCIVFTLLVARPSSSASRMWRGCPPLGCLLVL